VTVAYSFAEEANAVVVPSAADTAADAFEHRNYAAAASQHFRDGAGTLEESGWPNLPMRCRCCRDQCEGTERGKQAIGCRCTKMKVQQHEAAALLLLVLLAIDNHATKEGQMYDNAV
jgi:hypothetical protein